jgi:hypothetical protein
MGSSHSPADDIVYNLVSIQYHALKAADLYDTYLQDADPEHDEVVHPHRLEAVHLIAFARTGVACCRRHDGSS